MIFYSHNTWFCCRTYSLDHINSLSLYTVSLSLSLSTFRCRRCLCRSLPFLVRLSKLGRPPVARFHYFPVFFSLPLRRNRIYRHIPCCCCYVFSSDGLHCIASSSCLTNFHRKNERNRNIAK